MTHLNNNTPFILRMINAYGIIPAVIASVFFMLVLLLPLLVLGDYIVHGEVILQSILSGLINAAIIAPIFVYFLLRILNELNITKEKLRYLVVRDELTGVFNRRYMEERLKQSFSLSKRHNTAFGILLLDLDHFKSINDTYSHLAGDLVIQKVAKLCSNMLRDSDIFARCGGEEFCCLVNDTSKTDIERLANRINQAVADMDIIFKGQRIAVTISIGIAKFKKHHESIEDVLLSADKALYQAKQAGRNKVIIG